MSAGLGHKGFDVLGGDAPGRLAEYHLGFHGDRVVRFQGAVLDIANANHGMVVL